MLPRDRVKADLGRLWMKLGGPARFHEGRTLVLTFHRIVADDTPDADVFPGMDVREKDFRALLEWMAALYQPLSPAAFLQKPPAEGGPYFMVTFDDGWEDNYTRAFPILQRMNLPAAIFIATGAVHDRTPFWWQPLWKSHADIEEIKRRSTAERELLARQMADTFPLEMFSNEFLRWRQIREMAESGLVYFGAHGHRHTILTELTRPIALLDLQQNLSLMERHVPAAARLPALAWPNGNVRQDLTGELAESGLVMGFSATRGTISGKSFQPWALPRNNVDSRLAADPALWPWLLRQAT